MSIEREIELHINTNSRKDSKKNRNFELIAYYYGFRKYSWPTYEITKDNFDVETRERVRTILDIHFRSVVSAQQLPSVYKVLDIVKQKEFWHCQELKNKIEESGYAGNKFSLRGLLNLFTDLKIDHEYEIYYHDLEKASRRNIDFTEQTYTISSKIIKKARNFYKASMKLPGQCGIANLNYIKNDFSSSEIFDFICLLIKKSPNAWHFETNNGLWYVFENRDNTLNNYSSKLFNIAEKVDIKKLAESYKKSLFSRVHKYPYPPLDIIEQYFITSKKYIMDGKYVHYMGELRELCDIDKSVVKYLIENGQVSLCEIRDQLKKEGYGIPYINKAVFFSPLIHVDKSLGKGSHLYSYIGNQNVSKSSRDKMYYKYKNKLKKIFKKGTDCKTEANRRREQNILQAYIINGMKNVRCAICGKSLMKESIVAAHKKKRSLCTEEQRLDPYIVMPLCKFGCDHLYEQRYIRVVNGKVVSGDLPAHAAHEIKKINEVLGRSVQRHWLKGKESYFDN
jgi:hypothetical protein